MKKKYKNGLDKIEATIVDVDISSVFDIFMPKQLRLGNNEIKLRLIDDNIFLKNSQLLFDILDLDGNPLYYEVSNIANEDKTRSIIVTVTEADLIGPAKFYIYGQLTETSSYLTIINTEINTKNVVEQGIKFDTPPTVEFSEIRLPVQKVESNNRINSVINSSGVISTIGFPIPKNFDADIIEKSELKTYNKNSFSSSNQPLELPTYTNLATINSTGFAFSSSFIGGQIFVQSPFVVPTDALTSSYFTNIHYTASIVNVISDDLIEVYPPFYKTVTYTTTEGLEKTVTFDRFTNQGKFSCTYLESVVSETGSYWQSYAVFNIKDINPVVGKVDSVEVSFKNLSLVGQNFQPIGNFNINDSNILIASNANVFDLKLGMTQKPLGHFESDFDLYWSTSSLPQIIQRNEVIDGVYLTDGQVFYLNDFYSPSVSKNSDWILRFNYFNKGEGQIDVYISGSGINSKLNDRYKFEPNIDSTIGTHIGSVSMKRSFAEIEFTATEETKITPKFRPQRGDFVISEVQVYPNKKNGLTTKQTRLFVPIPIATGSELSFRLDFVNPIGQKSTNYASILPSVYFKGNGLGPTN